MPWFPTATPGPLLPRLSSNTMVALPAQKASAMAIALTETQASRHNGCAISHSNIQLEPAAKTAEPCPLFLLAPQM